MQYEKSATLSTLQDQTLFQPRVYSFDSLASNSMKSSNPNSGCREVDIAKTLDTSTPDPNKNQGGIAVVQPTICIQGNCIDRADTAGCNGKGWTEDVSYTLNTIDRPAVVQGIPLLDDQGGSVIRGEDNAHVSPTLRAEAHGNVPAVVAGFKYLQGSAAGGIAYEEEKSPTIVSGSADASVVYALENHPNDSRVKISEDNVVQTLSGRMGTGGGTPQ